MLNFTALTPPPLPSVAGAGALPVAAPPPPNAGRGFQDELQRAQHHRVPGPGSEPPPRSTSMSAARWVSVSASTFTVITCSRPS